MNYDRSFGGREMGGMQRSHFKTLSNLAVFKKQCLSAAQAHICFGTAQCCLGREQRLKFHADLEVDSTIL